MHDRFQDETQQTPGQQSFSRGFEEATALQHPGLVDLAKAEIDRLEVVDLDAEEHAVVAGGTRLGTLLRPSTNGDDGAVEPVVELCVVCKERGAT